MKCLTNKQTQELIDGELTTKQSELYHRHIAECQNCTDKYYEQKALAVSIKGLINEMVNSPVRIPEFRMPTKPAQKEMKVRRIPLWAKVAAVLIPVFFVWKIMNFENKNDITQLLKNKQLYKMCSSMNANITFKENGEIIIVTNDNGVAVQLMSN